MADDSLKNPVSLNAANLSAASLPSGLSRAYEIHILTQSQDLTGVAEKANQAGLGAYDAQVKNDEQDEQLDDHEGRILANTSAISLVEVRVTTAEGKIVTLRSDVDFLLDEVIDIQSAVAAAENDIDNLQADYVSKKATALQSISSPVSVTTSLSVNGTKVVGVRQTGWTPATGSALLAAFNASQTYSASTTYSQAEISAIATGLVQARQRIKALEDMARAHGLIN